MSFVIILITFIISYYYFQCISITLLLFLLFIVIISFLNIFIIYFENSVWTVHCDFYIFCVLLYRIIPFEDK